MTKTALKLYALLVLSAMLGVSAWAGAQVGIADAIAKLLQAPAAGQNPWLIATLFDAYFGFLWFWLWLAWRETRWSARLLWLLGILVLGNLAMAAYLLWRLSQLPPGGGVRELLLRPA